MLLTLSKCIMSDLAKIGRSGFNNVLLFVSVTTINFSEDVLHFIHRFSLCYRNSNLLVQSREWYGPLWQWRHQHRPALKSVSLHVLRADCYVTLDPDTTIQLSILCFSLTILVNSRQKLLSYESKNITYKTHMYLIKIILTLFKMTV